MDVGVSAGRCKSAMLRAEAVVVRINCARVFSEYKISLGETVSDFQHSFVRNTFLSNYIGANNHL